MAGVLLYIDIVINFSLVNVFYDNRTPSIINVLYYSETSTCRRKQNISIYKQVLTNRFIFLNGQPGNKWNCKFDNRVMVFKATFNNISVISWWSVLLVEETRVPGGNHWPSHWQTLSQNVVSSTPCLSVVRTHNVSGNRHWLHR